MFLLSIIRTKNIKIDLYCVFVREKNTVFYDTSMKNSEKRYCHHASVIAYTQFAEEGRP